VRCSECHLKNSLYKAHKYETSTSQAFIFNMPDRKINFNSPTVFRIIFKLVSGVFYKFTALVIWEFVFISKKMKVFSLYLVKLENKV
jgi:hypothetical protein